MGKLRLVISQPQSAGENTGYPSGPSVITRMRKARRVSLKGMKTSPATASFEDDHES